MKKEKNSKIYFFKHEVGRTAADYLDTYNWLLGNDSKLAKRFRMKGEKAERNIKKMIKKRELEYSSVWERRPLAEEEKRPELGSNRVDHGKPWWKIF